MRQPILPFDLS